MKISSAGGQVISKGNARVFNFTDFYDSDIYGATSQNSSQESQQVLSEHLSGTHNFSRLFYSSSEKRF